MTKTQIIQQHRNEAINAIAKIYHPKNNFKYDQYSEESGAEQRESEIRYIIETMNKKIEVVKQKEKEKLERLSKKEEIEHTGTL